jgi:hypothetical protein
MSGAAPGLSHGRSGPKNVTKAAGEVFPKYAPHRPGTAPALGLRAG